MPYFNPRSFAVITATNHDSTLNANLMVSPDVVAGDIDVIVERGHSCAGAAYNAGMLRSRADIIAFIHQDVYLPGGWINRLRGAVSQIEKDYGSWAILGVWGIRAEGSFAGRVWCSGGNREHNGSSGIRPVVSVDEIVIVLNRSSKLRFDECLPGFHLYATDIICQARKSGMKAYAFDAPVIHNSRPKAQVFDSSFFAAYHYMQRKWSDDLPLRTCVVPVTRFGVPLYKAWLRREIRRFTRRPAPRGNLDPQKKARELGYEPSFIEQSV